MNVSPSQPCVWYVSKYVASPRHSGVVSRGYAIMRELAQRHVTAVIITSDFSRRHGGAVASGLHESTDDDGLWLYRLRTFKYQQTKSIRRILSWLDFEFKLLLFPVSKLPKPDAIVVSSLSLLTVLNGLRLKRKFGCRLIFEVRDIWPLTLTAEGGFGKRHPAVRALGMIEKLGYRKSDAIVGTMPNLAEHVENILGEAKPVFCIPMGIDPNALPGPNEEGAELASRVVPTDRFVVTYAGSIGISNALGVLFAAAEKMQDRDDVHFLVLGGGDLQEHYVHTYSGLPNVTFVPKVPKEWVHDFLIRSNLLYFAVHESEVWEYGLSLNKIIDYMLAGKPILASYSGYPSMINEAGCGEFVPAADADALVEAILGFAERERGDLAAMGQAGRAWLLANRPYKVLADGYLKILFPDGGLAG